MKRRMRSMTAMSLMRWTRMMRTCPPLHLPRIRQALLGQLPLLLLLLLHLPRSISAIMQYSLPAKMMRTSPLLLLQINQAAPLPLLLLLLRGAIDRQC